MSSGPVGTPDRSPEPVCPSGGRGALTRLSQRLLGFSSVGRRRASGCQGCGACCEHFGGHLRAAKADVERWRSEGRGDLLSRVNRLGWLWVDPDSGKPVERCPFLERTDSESTRCAIHHTKPEMCRSYPTLAHGRRCVRGIAVH